ncbi:MAG TPA: sugar ABC transporter permease [Roseiflexaceae bacterium]|nr:sugar ABC transporter permease [Roseiflexaceae bacterium]
MARTRPLAPASKRARLGRMAREEERAAYLFLLPWLVGIVLFLLGPIVASVLISMTNWNIISEPQWVGLENYREMLFEDRKFWQSIRVTLYYTVLAVPLGLVAGLAISLLLNLRLRGMYALRTILYLPSVISGVAVAVLWISLLNPELGAVNQFLRAVGVANPPRWLGSPTWAVPALVLVGLWGVGGGAIIYLAGLQNIPPQLYEAAEIDGAGAWAKFWHVTLPLLTPTLFFNLITGLIGAFQVFDTAFIMGGSRGGTSGALNFYLLNLWNEGFRQGRLGYASALAWVLVLLAALVITVTFRTSDRWVYYEAETGKSEG